MIFFQSIRSVLGKLARGYKDSAQEVTRLLSRSSIIYASLMILGLIVVGVGGYSVLEGWSLLEALYATVITITTVGYGDLSPQTTGGRVFAIFFTLTAIGIAGYALSTVAAFVIEREHERVKRLLQERRMQQIANLNDHIIVCGGGYMGKRIANEFYRSGAPFVVIEDREDILRWTILYLHKDYVEKKIMQRRELAYLEYDTSDYEQRPIAELADEAGVLYLQEKPTQDATLLRAGIQRARGLVSVMEEDKDNLFVVLSARELARRLNNPELRIISRVMEEENSGKLRAAGADKVASPHVIGGFQIASHMLYPEMGAFWDHMLYRDDQLFRFGDLILADHPELVGKSVDQVRQERAKMVIAIKRQGQYEYMPEPETRLEAGDVLIVLGRQQADQSVVGHSS